MKQALKKLAEWHQGCLGKGKRQKVNMPETEIVSEVFLNDFREGLTKKGWHTETVDSFIKRSQKSWKLQLKTVPKENLEQSIKFARDWYYDTFKNLIGTPYGVPSV